MKITKTDMKSLMEIAGVPMDSPKVQKLIEMEMKNDSPAVVLGTWLDEGGDMNTELAQLEDFDGDTIEEFRTTGQRVQLKSGFELLKEFITRRQENPGNVEQEIRELEGEFNNFTQGIQGKTGQFYYLETFPNGFPSANLFFDDTSPDITSKNTDNRPR